MRLIKAPKLNRGDVIGIAAPASPHSSDDQLALGIRYLESAGFRVALAENVFKRQGYLAGSDADRSEGFLSLIRNKYVKAIFMLRGGYGSLRLLPFLDYSLIRRNPKIIIGYSDVTALLMAIFRKTGLVTFTGPMLTGELAGGLNKKSEQSLWECLCSIHPPPVYRTYKTGFRHGMGIATGTLLGGNLSTLASLAGTPYFPVARDTIWILEEIDERPYRIDRMLHQLNHAGAFRRAQGFALGAFTDCKAAPGKPSLTLETIFSDLSTQSNAPLTGSFRYGHIESPLTFPLGIPARLNSAKGALKALEGGVS